MSKRGVNINDLPECYRNQVADKITNMEQVISYGTLAKSESAQYNTPVNIGVHIRAKRPCDCDGYCAKYPIDSIVENGILKDDNAKCVKEIRFTQEKSEFDETIITITPVAP